MSPALPLAAAAAGGAPLAPTAEQGRDLALRELADPAYAAAQPGLVERVRDAVLDALSRLQVPDGGSAVQALALLALLAGVVVVVALVGIPLPTIFYGGVNSRFGFDSFFV